MVVLPLIYGCGGHTHSQMPGADTTFYSVHDFASVEKIDAHVHIRTTDTTLVQLAREDNFRLLTIVVEEEPGMDLQEKYAIRQKTDYPQVVSFATTFSIKDWNTAGWSNNTILKLKRSIENGAIAVKVYKSIGMELRDSHGDLVMIDDPGFDSVLNFLINAKVPVIGHLGEPKDCWLPLDQMQSASNRRYYSRHPEYHMYLHTEYPTYEQQISARDHMLEKHPDLKFVGAHLGSVEWDTDSLAMHLDKLPNMAVDMAARISELQLLTKKNWQKVHDFFIRYQDRLIYGTDRISEGNGARDKERAFIHEAWLRDWVFFATDSLLRSSSFEGDFRGLKLPKVVIDKIYNKNARKWINGLRTGD